MRTCPKCHGEVLIDGKALTRIVSEPPEIAALRAALAGLQQEADGQRQARDTAESSLAQALLAKDSAIGRANRAESQRDRAVEVLRLLCDAAFVSETQFVCPTAFEPAVRAARALLKDAPCPRP